MTASSVELLRCLCKIRYWLTLVTTHAFTDSMSSVKQYPLGLWPEDHRLQIATCWTAEFCKPRQTRWWCPDCRLGLSPPPYSPTAPCPQSPHHGQTKTRGWWEEKHDSFPTEIPAKYLPQILATIPSPCVRVAIPTSWLCVGTTSARTLCCIPCGSPSSRWAGNLAGPPSWTTSISCHRMCWTFTAAFIGEPRPLVLE